MKYGATCEKPCLPINFGKLERNAVQEPMVMGRSDSIGEAGRARVRQVFTNTDGHMW